MTRSRRRCFVCIVATNACACRKPGADDPAYFFESLGYLVPGGQLDPYFAEFLPEKEGRLATCASACRGASFFLLSGTLDVRHGEVTHRVEAGDAIYFDANTIHSYVCTSKTPATAVIVTLQHPLMLQMGNGSRAINLGNGKIRGVSEAILAAGGPRKNSERMQ